MVRPVSHEKLEHIKHSTSSDPRRVLDYTVNGWPKYAKDVPEQIRPYHAFRGDLSVADGKIIYHNRLVIPCAIQSEALEHIYDGHQGVT